MLEGLLTRISTGTISTKSSSFIIAITLVLGLAASVITLKWIGRDYGLLPIYEDKIQPKLYSAYFPLLTIIIPAFLVRVINALKRKSSGATPAGDNVDLSAPPNNEANEEEEPQTSYLAFIFAFICVLIWSVVFPIWLLTSNRIEEFANLTENALTTPQSFLTGVLGVFVLKSDVPKK